MKIVLLTPTAANIDPGWSMAEYTHLAIDEPSRAVLTPGLDRTDLLLLAGYATQPKLLRELEALCANVEPTRIALAAPKPDLDFVLGLMRLGIREVWPDLAEEHLHGFRLRRGKTPERVPAAPSASRGPVLGVISAKGGDGGSFVAANLSVALAESSGQPTLLMDMALPFGDIDTFLPRHKTAYDLADFCDDLDRLDRELVDMMAADLGRNLQFVPSLRAFERFSAVTPQHLERLIRRLSEAFSWVVLDLGSGISPVAANLMNQLDRIAVVSTPTVPSLKRTTQIVRLWERLGREPDRLDVVLNRVSRRWDLPPEKFAATLGRPVDWTLANLPEPVNEAVISGKPLVVSAPRSAIAVEINAWAARHTGNSTPRKESLWQRLVTR